MLLNKVQSAINQLHCICPNNLYCFLIPKPFIYTWPILSVQINSIQFILRVMFYQKYDAIDNFCAQYDFYFIETGHLESLSIKMFFFVIKHDFYNFLATHFGKNHHSNVILIEITSIIVFIEWIWFGEMTKYFSINITRWLTKLNFNMWLSV